MNKLSLIYSVLAIALAAGCTVSSTGGVEAESRSVALAAEAGTPASQYTFHVQSRDVASLANRAAAIIGILNRGSVPSDEVARAITRVEDRDWAVTVDGTPIALSYDPSFDVLYVGNSVVTEDYTTLKDIGIDAARETFRSTLSQLIETGLVNSSLAADTAEVRNLIEGGGYGGEAPTERVKEYWFYVPLVVDGARVRRELREAGVRISVNRDGRVASIRSAGPESWTAAEQTVRQVSDAEIATRLNADFPKATIRPLGPTYILEDGQDDTVIGPRLAYYVSRQFEASGRTYNSRAQVVSYAVDDKNLVYQAWPPPNPNDTGDVRAAPPTP